MSRSYARHVVRAIASAALALGASASGSAGAVKPEPLVPVFVQKLVRSKAGSLAYVPTRAPFGYRYVRFRWDAERRVLTITLVDRRLPAGGRHSIVFTARRFAGTLATCGSGRLKTLQMGGNKVYWDGESAWRCVRGSNGRLVRITASGPNLPDVALGRVTASAKRVAASQR